jgi:DNA-binding NarL/FixJ family response regulator
MTVRILIVDDHEIVRESIRTLLGKTRPEWTICGESANVPPGYPNMGSGVANLTNRARGVTDWNLVVCYTHGP